MSASFCDHCSFGKCEIDDEECEYDNFDYEDKCHKFRKRKRRDDDDDDDDDDGLLGLATGIALGGLLGGDHSGGFGGFGGGGFGGGGGGGKF
jgi:hypothetical protein